MKKYIPSGYYVYCLIDPFTEAVFYVGKGKGVRMYQHEVRVRNLRELNKPKHDVIQQINSLGGQVVYRVVAEGLTEAEAFKLEKETIENIGINALTNLQQGQNDAQFHLLQLAKSVFSRLRRPKRLELSNHPATIAGPSHIYCFVREAALTGQSVRFDAYLAGQARRNRFINPP